TSSRWKVELWHTQPLRLREITVVDATATVVSSGTSVIWLAQPNTTYTLYADAATQPNIQTTESPDLTSDPETIIEATLGTSLENPSFVEPDDDSDGVADFKDNCIKVANTDQTDLDQDQLGDLCEDHDADGLIASKDNCPDITNSNQTDTDEDGIGDVCDTEESRVTERLPWLPWVGMGLAALVVIGVIAGSLRREKI
ncbi:MAG: thrombospondin type 3 repeat-containing protein, partial [Candidatus Gracilibacteria bacterium]